MKKYKDYLFSTLFVVVLYGITISMFYLAITREYHVVEGFGFIRIVLFILLAPLLFKYIIQLVFAPFQEVASKVVKGHKQTDELLAVTVFIPAWNEEIGVLKTIKSVVNTNYPDLQIIIINDGSTDATHDVITQFLEDHEEIHITVDYINQSNKGKAVALNNALAKAKGEVIVTVDSDSVMDSSTIHNLVKHFSDPKVGGVAGNVIVGNRRKPIEWMQQMEYMYGFFFKRADSLFNSVYIIGGAAAAYRKSVLEDVGHFDHEIITEDIEMSTRILSCGYKTRYAPDAVVFTEGPSSLKGLCHQRLRWKYGRILTFFKHRKLFFRLRQEHQPYLTLMLLPLAVYAECLLLLEVVLLTTFFAYTVVCSDYMPLVAVILVLATIIMVQVLFDSKRKFHSNLLFLAPVAWLIFYLMDMVELQALLRTIRRLITGRNLKWQRWVRIGIEQEEV